MKTPFKFLLLLVCAVSPLARAAGNDDDVRKEKTVSKTFSVNPDATLDVTNRYGSVYVTTTDEAVISIKAVVKVSGKNPDAVEKRLNGIDIELEGSRSLVSARTKISGNGGRTSIEINYTISIPRKGNIKINNQYGPVLLDRIAGDASLNLQYGRLTAAALEGDTALNMQYCNGSQVTSLRAGTVNIQYSDLTVAKARTITANSDYSDLRVDDVDNLSVKMDYGSLKVKSAATVVVNGNYFGMDLGTLEKSLTARGNYDSFKIGNILPGAGNVTISGDYTNVEVGHDANYAFDFDIKLNYVDFRPPSGWQYKSRRETHSSTSYQGTYKTPGANRLTIDLNYGSLKVDKKP